MFNPIKNSIGAVDPISSHHASFSGNCSLDYISVIRKRIFFLSIVFVICFSAVIAKSFYWIVFLQPEKKVFMQHNMGKRADIVDRNDNLLATSLKVDDARLDVRQVTDPYETVTEIMSVFPDANQDKIISDLFSKIAESEKYNHKKLITISVKKDVTPEEKEKVLQTSLKLDYIPSYKRYYPEQNYTREVIGRVSYLDKPFKEGTSGLEQALNDILSTNDSVDIPIKTTLDITVQKILHDEIKSRIDIFNAKGGAGIVTNIKDGSILGLVSIDKDKDKKDKNRIIQDTYMVGSTLKIINTAIGLETGRVTLDKRYNTDNPIFIGKKRITEFDNKRFGVLNVAEILQYSSNIGSANIALEFGPYVQKYLMTKLGFFTKQDIELNGSATGYSAKQWGRSELITSSYGYNVNITPLNLVTAISTILNDGIYIKPTLIQKNEEKLVRVEDENKTLDDKAYHENLAEYLSKWTSSVSKRINAAHLDLSNITPREGQRIFSQKTSDAVKYAMRLVCEPKGSGKSANTYGYPVIGKTGTAEKVENGRYSKSARLSSFVAAFPVDNPQYLVYIIIDEPQAQAGSRFATGGVVSAPAVGKVIAKIAPYLEVKPINIDPNSTQIGEMLLNNYHNKYGY